MARIKHLRQRDIMDCGPTGLAMINNYYGQDIDIESIRQKAQIGKEGVNLLGISEAAESIGYRTQAVQLSFKELKSAIKKPAILHWQQNHFVVFIPSNSFWGSNKVKIADPAKGIIKMAKKDFLAAWESDNIEADNTNIKTGIALLLEPTPLFFEKVEFETNDIEKKKGISIISYITPYYKLILVLR